MKTQSKLGITISLSTGCGCDCFASIIKQGSDAVLYIQDCVGFSIEWQKYALGTFTTDQVGGTTYSLIGVGEPIRVKLSNDDCCTKFSNIL